MSLEPDDSWTPLREAAEAVLDAAHAPYSRFRVGAALEAADGRTYSGCNIENASFPVTMCAERVALGSAVADGATRFTRLYLVSDAAEPVAPCGMCRQALAEFAPELRIVSRGLSGEETGWRLAELLPATFELATGGETA
ncbi:MAG: cytidine deaminase [Gemmatimonadales bacterium]|jgi:cytidine deaminase